MSRVIAAPVTTVWQTFIDRDRRAGWVVDGVADARLSLTVLEPGRRCAVGLAGSAARRLYAFAPVEVGAHRGGTMVTVLDEQGPRLAARLFDLVSGGFVARTVEGAVRAELDALARACLTRVIAVTAA